jgi:hypothetical protein
LFEKENLGDDDALGDPTLVFGDNSFIEFSSKVLEDTVELNVSKRPFVVFGKRQMLHCHVALEFDSMLKVELPMP